MSQAHSKVYLETLRHIAMELGPQHSFISGLRVLLRTLAEKHPLLRPHLVIFDPPTRTLRLCLADTEPRAGNVVYEPGVGITGQVFTLGKPVIVERLCDNTLFQNKFFSRTPGEMHALGFLSVPVMGRGEDLSGGLEVLGVLSADTPTASRAVMEERIRFLEVVAAMIGTQVSYWQQEMALSMAPRTALPESLVQQGAAASVITVSKSMRLVFEKAVQAGGSRGAVLLRGEAGTGKELLAEVVHQASPRRDMPLVRVNCASIAPEQWESEFFGVQKGTHPSVLQTRKGLLEKAHMGTLLLQGLEVLPVPLQGRLVRAMREHELWRVGAEKPVAVNVRLLWASQRSPVELQEQGLISAEVLAHFLTWDIALLPLRERPEDILPLAEHFLARAAATQEKSIERFAPAMLDALLRYTWPSNAHELKYCMERAVRCCHEDTLQAWHLPPSVRGDKDDVAKAVNFGEAVARLELELLRDALQKTGGNVLEASRLLKTSYRIINYKVKKYALNGVRSAGRTATGIDD